MAGASLLTVTFLVRGQSLNVVPSEIPLVVGVVFLSPVDLLLATVAAEVLSSVAKQRPPSKAVFNILMFAGAAVAALASLPLDPGRSIASQLEGMGRRGSCRNRGRPGDAGRGAVRGRR